MVCCGLGKLEEAPPSAALARALKRLHTALTVHFDPTISDHDQHLQNIWNALLAPAEFARPSPLWKDVGFQGMDPSTDVRGGGLLSIQCLDHFATLHTMGLRAMLEDLKHLAAHGGELAYYPVSTTAVVLCTRLCDACGLSAGMRGAIKPDDLAALLKTPPPTEVAVHLWPLLVDRQRRGGFCGIFALLIADFHVRFILMRASYMQSQEIVTAVLATLARRLALVHVGMSMKATRTSSSAGSDPPPTPRRRSTLEAVKRLVTSSAPDAARERYVALFHLYAHPDPSSDSGPSHAQDVHALLTATEQRRATSIKIFKKAIALVALQEAAAGLPHAKPVDAVDADDAEEAVESADAGIDADGAGSVRMIGGFSSYATWPAGAPRFVSYVTWAGVSVAAAPGGAGSGETSSGAADASTAKISSAKAERAARRAARRVSAPAQPTSANTPEASVRSAAAEARPRGMTISAMVRAAVSAKESEQAAPLAPMALSLPTSTALRAEQIVSDVTI